MSFKVGDPPNRVEAQNALVDLQVAVAEHADQLSAQDKASEERRDVLELEVDAEGEGADRA